jgi:hypothetical protein
MDDRPEKQLQDYFDALMSGNLARRHMLKFVPADFKLIETHQPPLQDQYDEWLARVICYAFSVPASAFVSQVNRATSETLRMQATQERLVPLKAWVKTALDQVVQVHLKQADLEFVWVGDDAVDPLEQAQTLQILVGAGIKTREEARADLGLAPEGKSGDFWKYNENHDERGRFSGCGATLPRFPMSGSGSISSLRSYSRKGNRPCYRRVPRPNTSRAATMFRSKIRLWTAGRRFHRKSRGS